MGAEIENQTLTYLRIFGCENVDVGIKPTWILTPAPPHFHSQISSGKSVSDSQFLHPLNGLNNLISQEYCEDWLNNT